MDSQWTNVLDEVKFFQRSLIGPKFWPNFSKVMNVQKKFKNREKNLCCDEGNMFRILAFCRTEKHDWTPNGQRQKSGLLMDILTGHVH
jgi:hypothetical protein